MQNTCLQLLYKLPFTAAVLIILFCAKPLLANTLDQLYAQAKQNTATVQVKKLDELIAQEKKDQTVAAVLPTLTASTTKSWQQENSSAVFNTQSETQVSTLSLSQPIFQGTSEYYALSIAKKLPEIAKWQRIQTEINFYAMIAEAFYKVLRLTKEQKILQDQVKTLKSRVSTLQKRSKIGRSKATDVLDAQSQLARLTAEEARTQSNLVIAKQKLRNITGLNKLPTLNDKTDISTLKIPPHWGTHLANNPRIKSAELILENAKKEIAVARGGYFPTLDLEGNYYLDRQGLRQTHDWDVSVVASWELFSGGEDSSKKSIAEFEAQKLEGLYLDLKRNLNNDFIALKKEFQSQQQIIEKLKFSRNLAQKNYQQHLREVSQGLVGELDVTRALENYLTAEQTYEEQIYETKNTWIQLRTLAGVRP